MPFRLNKRFCRVSEENNAYHLLMTLRPIGHQHAYSRNLNMEVVVSVHAGWTTTSEESQLGIIT